EFSVAEHVGKLLAAIEEDASVGAFVSVAGEQALAEAEAADERIRALGPAAWRDRPLLGVTIAVKDLIQTRDLPTTRGSLLDNRRPRVDAPAVARLRAAGAIIVGKTTTSEYGWSTSTVSRVTGPTRNPWDPDRSAGGSSGGSAAAVAAGLCAAALGTDGAGSIRIPAAFCGVVGYKPSFGRVPYVPPCADRLAQVGPMTATVSDAMELAALIAGAHPHDPDSGTVVLDTVPRPRALRIAWIEFPGTTPEVGAVAGRVRTVLTGQGHRLTATEVPFADPYQAMVDLVAAGEAAGTRHGDEARADPGRLAVVRHGRTLRGTAVARAEEVRLALRTTLRGVMGRFDLLAMPTVPVEPFGAGAIAPDWAADPADLLWLAWTPATYPFNLTGQPALSLPAGLTASGLPVGVQLVGPFGADQLVLSTARSVEAELEPLPRPPGRPTERML
ncbi:amidase, partial [Actinophytocola sp.]|uniref:amidase n=1 Tax=Actinophytocola sp. TaxID=1872138 RepID=UPI002D7EA89B